MAHSSSRSLPVRCVQRPLHFLRLDREENNWASILTVSADVHGMCVRDHHRAMTSINNRTSTRNTKLLTVGLKDLGR